MRHWSRQGFLSFPDDTAVLKMCLKLFHQPKVKSQHNVKKASSDLQRKCLCCVFVLVIDRAGRKNDMGCPKWYNIYVISETNIRTNAKTDETSNKGAQYTCNELIVLHWMDEVRTRKWHSPQGQNTLEL